MYLHFASIAQYPSVITIDDVYAILSKTHDSFKYHGIFLLSPEIVNKLSLTRV